jgi:Spy/CpxP family protein refolding chaperone
MKPMIDRRYFLGVATLLLGAVSLFVPAGVASAQQMSAKPEVKISEARAVITKYVDKMSQAAKKEIGFELTQAQKVEMVDAILDQMKEQRSYDFIDP